MLVLQIAHCPEFAKIIGDLRGPDFAPINFEVADDLASWSAEIPGKVVAKDEALTGPMTQTMVVCTSPEEVTASKNPTIYRTLNRI
ncbi:MAG: DUF1326 domain-containing protein [Nitrososphaeraceae archaeon]|nr:DUF1326 domain-containing protein [Nitrososphaeraceae archaeon]